VAIAACRARRARRACIARRLVAGASDAVADLSWEALDRAPDWLTLPDDALRDFLRRVGASMYAPALRMWIDGARLAAARDLLGAEVLAALLARPDTGSIDEESSELPPIDGAAAIAPVWRLVGAGVALASLPQDTLRQAAAAALAPAADTTVSPDRAGTIVAQAQALVAGGAAPPTAQAPCAGPGASAHGKRRETSSEEAAA
jgi:hypothetical protein